MESQAKDALLAKLSTRGLGPSTSRVGVIGSEGDRRRGTPDSDFDGGVYHGRIVLPPEYPMKPPSIILLTVRVLGFSECL